MKHIAFLITLILSTPALAGPFGIDLMSPPLDRCKSNELWPSLYSCGADVLDNPPEGVDRVSFTVSSGGKVACEMAVFFEPNASNRRYVHKALTDTYGNPENPKRVNIRAESGYISWKHKQGYREVALAWNDNNELLSVKYEPDHCRSDEPQF